MKKRIYHASEVAKGGEKARKTVFCETDATSCAVWVVRAGQEVAAHAHTKSDDVWVCLQGEGMFYLDKDDASATEKTADALLKNKEQAKFKSERPATYRQVSVKKGDVIISAKGECHGMKNTGKEDFIFISVIAPLPADYVALG
ncbi:cupin domain-containing protein [Campylobacter curvus]|uniref:cupin domain-containing protein n=1 Tax=Campylobacter curvus TaxID=200 RepID=UPI00146FE795|nr:cupin domain-containing protein [Campylobacter curvus]